MSFQKRLKETRMQRQMSQTALAKKINISQQAYAQYETGASSPNPETLLLIAEELDVSIDYLLGREEKPPNEITFDDFTYAMYNESKELTDEDKQQLLRMAQFFRDQMKEK